MIKIAVVGDIGSGKSHVAKQFGYPVFNADREVATLYQKSRNCYKKLKNKFPNYITSFPISKIELSRIILKNKNNIKKINKIVHPLIRKRMNIFFKKNKNKKIVILDIPLLIENKINKKNYLLVYVDARKKEINKRLKKRFNYNRKIVRQLKKFQLPLELKKRKSDYIIKNNFNINSVRKNVKSIIKKIILNV